MEDALALGFDKVADCLTTTGGGAEIGLDMEKMPADLAKAIDDCTIIISKGMANYESLSEYENLPPVAYLMCVKCEMIAEDIGNCKGIEDCNAANSSIAIFSCSLRSISESDRFSRAPFGRNSKIAILWK